MTSELETLRSLADRVRPPAFDALEEVARLRTRRAAAAAAVGCVLSVLVVAGGIALVTAHDDRSAPEPVITPTTSTATPTAAPTPTRDPTPTHESDTSMTLEEVVSAPDATLQMTGVSADDPDFRVSIWEATCHWCPKGAEARFKPTFRALAITSDGYASATLRRVPFDTGIEHVESVGPGLLVIVDWANGYEWLVRDDGTLTTLARDFDEVAPADPRLWFPCLANTGRTGPGGQALPFDVRTTWCVLDPDADTVHIRTVPWAGTPDDSRAMAHPGPGTVPWGFYDPITGPTRPADADPHLVAWWEADGSRRHQDLGRATATGAVLNGPPGLMSLWSWVKGSNTLAVFTSSDQGASWQETDLVVPVRPMYFLSLSWTPDGDLVGREDDAFYPDGDPHEGDGLRLWRADFVDGGSFDVVLEAQSGNANAHEGPRFTVFGERLWASRFWSDDDGRTWTEPLSWR